MKLCIVLKLSLIHILIVEILYNEKDVAIIRKFDGQLILQWYAKDSNLEVPVDWFLGLLEEAKVRLSYE